MAENVTLTWWSFVNRMCTFPVNFSWILGSNLDWDWWKTLGLASFIHPFHSLVVSFHQGFHSSKNQKFNFTFTRFEFLFDRCFIFQEEQFIFLFDKQIFLLFPQRIKIQIQKAAADILYFCLSFSRISCSRYGALFQKRSFMINYSLLE